MGIISMSIFRRNIFGLLPKIFLYNFENENFWNDHEWNVLWMTRTETNLSFVTIIYLDYKIQVLSTEWCRQSSSWLRWWFTSLPKWRWWARGWRRGLLKHDQRRRGQIWPFGMAICHTIWTWGPWSTSSCQRVS